MGNLELMQSADDILLQDALNNPPDGWDEVGTDSDTPCEGVVALDVPNPTRGELDKMVARILITVIRTGTPSLMDVLDFAENALPGGKDHSLYIVFKNMLESEGVYGHPLED